MARIESDREDLLREATALVERAELQLPDHAQPIVIGFRRDGSGSLYCGGEPVFQFNTRRELRRAYWQGRLIKAEDGQLVALSRQRTSTAVELIRRQLTDEEEAGLLIACREWVERIIAAIAAGRIAVTGQVPADGAVLERIRQWLQELPSSIEVACRPNVG